MSLIIFKKWKITVDKVKPACYYIGEQEESLQGREVDRKDQKIFLKRKLKKVSKSRSNRFRHAESIQDSRFKILRAKRCKRLVLLETQLYFFRDPIGRSATKRNENRIGRRHPASSPMFYFFVRSGNVPEKGIKAKAKNQRSANAGQEAKAKSRKRRREMKQRKTIWGGDYEWFKSSDAEYERKLWEPKGKYYKESWWGQWLAKHSSILSAAHCASDNI